MTRDTATKPRSFQEIILRLQAYWAEQGCAVMQPYDMEVGAGTFHPATALRSLGPDSWNAAYVQPSRRPTDGRYGENPNRLQHYYQFQVILKPSPDDVQDVYLQSLGEIGIDEEHLALFLRRDGKRKIEGAIGLALPRMGRTDEHALRGGPRLLATQFGRLGQHLPLDDAELFEKRRHRPFGHDQAMLG